VLTISSFLFCAKIVAQYLKQIKDGEDIFWETRHEQAVILKEKSNYCPACKQYSLEFEEYGLWD